MFLEKYLDDFYYNMVVDNYDYSYLEGLDEDNFKEIYKLLKEYHFYYINDIILNYIEIFSLDKEEVEQKIKELKEKFGHNYVYLIGDDMRALDYILI